MLTLGVFMLLFYINFYITRELMSPMHAPLRILSSILFWHFSVKVFYWKSNLSNLCKCSVMPF